MSGGWQPLLTLRCRHDYFADGVCRPFKLVPTAACLQQLARYQMAFRPAAGGGIVYYQPGISALDDYTETAPLAFWLMNGDLALDGYTALDEAAAGAEGLFYFDNLGAAADASGIVQLNAAPDDDGVLWPQPPGGVTAPRLPTRGARFSFVSGQPVRAASMALYPRLPGLDGAPCWSAASPDAWLAGVPVALGAIAEGRYRLTLEGSAALDFWLGTPPAGAWGVAAVYAGGKAQAGSLAPVLRAIAADGTVQPLTCEIGLTALALPWRYNVIAESGIAVDWSHYELVATPAGGQPVGFSGKAGTPIDGRSVYQFVSDAPLPFTERPSDVLAVHLHPGAHARHLLPLSLAYPEPANVRLDGDVRYAEVYAHL